jgi:hypothetical protein
MVVGLNRRESGKDGIEKPETGIGGYEGGK